MIKADNLPPFCAVVTKSGNLNFLEPSGPVQACNGSAFFLVVVVVVVVLLLLMMMMLLSPATVAHKSTSVLRYKYSALPAYVVTYNKYCALDMKYVALG